MAGRINDEDIQELRQRADLAAVIGDYTSLKRAGARLSGLCPFHEEKTPSFTVDPGRGLYHCFGCQVGGDVYGFLQQIEALTFPEAVERLARIVGYELRYEELSAGQRRTLGRRTRLTEVLLEAARFFEGQLAGEGGAAARAYLAKRGLDRADAEHFRIGWAPDAWDGLAQHLRTAGYTDEESTAAGLVTEGSRGPIDRFRGRVIFPILDKSGKDVVAFGGRVLPGVDLRTWSRDSSPPKYINSPETEVYRKSQVLYGLNWARAEIQRRETALVVEGYMDVIGLHTAGVRHAVATCGTALTAEHFRQLEHFTPRVVLALDADDAGAAAADRARSLAEEVGVREVGVLPLPDDADPADLAAEGAERVEAALNGVKTAVEFQIEHLLRGADASTPEGQVSAYRATFPLLARIPDRALRYRYMRDVVAPAVGLSADRIEAELDVELPRLGAEAPGSSAPAQPPAAPGDVTGAGARTDPQMHLERDVLRAALQEPGLMPPAWKLVTEDDFRAPMSRQLFAALAAAGSDDLNAVLAVLPDDETRVRVRALALSEPTVEADPSHLHELVVRLRARSVEREHDGVRDRLFQVGEQLDVAERRQLQARLFELERRRRDLLEGRDA